MKNTLKIINVIILFLTIHTNSQTLDISKIADNGPIPISGVYYKDNLNLLNQFEGKYRYVNGSTILEIELIKKINKPFANTGAFYDFVAGEVKYIENGVLKINTLPNLNQNSSLRIHAIEGFGILNNHNDYPCTTCYTGQKRLRASFENPLNDKVDIDLFFKIITLPNGTVTMEMMMRDRTAKVSMTTGPIDWGTHLFPVQTYVLTKI